MLGRIRGNSGPAIRNPYAERLNAMSDKSAPPLAGDFLPDILAIARYVLNDDSISAQRRIRHLVRIGQLPAKKVGGRVSSRKSWIDTCPTFSQAEVA
jgi:hypothetical protein